jgi:hypothetical protein
MPAVPIVVVTGAGVVTSLGVGKRQLGGSPPAVRHPRHHPLPTDGLRTRSPAPSIS